MPAVLTLTLNPTIDSACEAERVFPTHKVRTHGQRYDPGGGGINVARVLARFGVPVEAAYLGGGVTGALLDELLDQSGLARHRVPIHDHTRMSLAVFERATGQEYRFVPEGPLVSEGEWHGAIDHCLAAAPDWLVASGSLPRGAPEGTYAELAARLPAATRLVLDTSGPALTAAIEAGGLFLVKPSQGEFEALCGRSFATPDEVGEAATALAARGAARYIAVTMGHRGAVLADVTGHAYRPSAPVEVRSATGAGDSFVAGMVHGFVLGDDAPRAFARGMAAGSAAVLSPGTDLCHPEDVERLLAAYP